MQVSEMDKLIIHSGQHQNLLIMIILHIKLILKNLVQKLQEKHQQLQLLHLFYLKIQILIIRLFFLNIQQRYMIQLINIEEIILLLYLLFKDFIVVLVDIQMNQLGGLPGYIELLEKKNILKNIILLQMQNMQFMTQENLQNVESLFHGMIKGLEHIF